jgi:hypothetical protein
MPAKKALVTTAVLPLLDRSLMTTCLAWLNRLAWAELEADWPKSGEACVCPFTEFRLSTRSRRLAKEGSCSGP